MCMKQEVNSTICLYMCSLYHNSHSTEVGKYNARAVPYDDQYFFFLSKWPVICLFACYDTYWGPCLFPIIIGLSVEISDNPTKRLAYFCFCGNPLQRFELRGARIEKRENLRFSQPRLDYKLIENKQGHWFFHIFALGKFEQSNSVSF